MNRPPADMVVHFGLSQEQMRRKTGSTGDFAGPRPLCGNGSFHCTTTDQAFQVTCEACKNQLARRPGFL